LSDKKSSAGKVGDDERMQELREFRRHQPRQPRRGNKREEGGACIKTLLHRRHDLEAGVFLI